MRPQSRGWVKLRSADPADKPRIQLNVLKEAADREAFRAMFRKTRAFFATEPAKGLVNKELYPGAAAQTDAELDAVIRQGVRTAMHPVGTCKMGTDDLSVVDAELKVRGLTGLRIVDCSIMPDIVGGNTNAPAIMIAEKAADMIRGKTTTARAAA